MITAYWFNNYCVENTYPLSLKLNNDNAIA